MRRIWIGVGFLVGLLAVGMVVMQITDRQLGQITRTLEQAAQVQNWEEAVTLTQKAQKAWQEKRTLMAALADHADIDTVDELFARAEVYQQRRAETDHAAVCAQLSEAIRALEENHSLTWWNLL